MNTKQIWKIIGLGVMLMAFVVLFSIATNNSRITTETSNQESEYEEKVSISIESFYTKKTIPISSNETALKVLERIDFENPELELSLKEYSGLGVLVESMNGNKNGTDNKYWQYKVNGIMPQIGADKLELHDGDFVEWYFSRSEF